MHLWCSAYQRVNSFPSFIRDVIPTFFLYWQSPECLGSLNVFFYRFDEQHIFYNQYAFPKLLNISFYTWVSRQKYMYKADLTIYFLEPCTYFFLYLINLTETVDIEILHKFHTAMVWAVWWSMSLSISNYRVTIKKKHK